jgi:hypothetical protein
MKLKVDKNAEVGAANDNNAYLLGEANTSLTQTKISN